MNDSLQYLLIKYHLSLINNLYSFKILQKQRYAPIKLEGFFYKNIRLTC